MNPYVRDALHDKHEYKADAEWSFRGKKKLTFGAWTLGHKIPNQMKWYKMRYCLRNRDCEDDQICGLGICINPCLYKKCCNNEACQVNNHKIRCKKVLLMTNISTTNILPDTTPSPVIVSSPL
ncbi:hypothetical protein KQX54_007792 [Cotesia glomerata]|uniref:Uncharacterized protein n=1 Tax=Cotesia glomerata TaxID=32391 RepID=A0AAV7J884_COTGL|nr:hypothetical protein KQX54_007792 [Cotesia glomerata]